MLGAQLLQPFFSSQQVIEQALFQSALQKMHALTAGTADRLLSHH
jgi:hypothetical protein